MPELPEVEVVRAGLERHVTGARVERVTVLTTRSVRRHLAGPADFAAGLAGARLGPARRRGKYVWLPLDDGDAVLAHLGMSGQLLVRPANAAPERHLRVRFLLEGGLDLRFVDQRTFGGMSRSRGGCRLPAEIAHIAPDPLEADFDESAFVRRLRARRTGAKRALLDQTLISGIGNIYADEGLWRAGLHFARPTETLRASEVRRLLVGVREVLVEALAHGGTSFDALYVDVDGQSGWFERSLAVYGREDHPCPRCGTSIRRDAFMNRSAYTCPRCQPRPRRARW